MISPEKRKEIVEWLWLLSIPAAAFAVAIAVALISMLTGFDPDWLHNWLGSADR
jgi:hypothetical protein